ncbi:MAG: TIGR04372 family glycosyltransferase [Proteobacteria bacterium]|nr:TIGR04372 family glycosyltransferase [Pseudomonadota bacterium]MBI3497191.1 TIGR04372 family glycosyltransferase [Pseudomonadota bacterium]
MSAAADPDRLGAAFALHRDGRLQEAAEQYRAILEADPNRVDALHLYGVLCLQGDNATEAKRLVELAISRQPLMAELHKTMSAVAEALGDRETMVASLHRCLTLNPAAAEAFVTLARNHERLSRMGDDSEWNAVALAHGLVCYDRAFAIRPDSINLCEVAGFHIEYGNRRRSHRHYDLWHQRRRPSRDVVEACGFQVVPEEVVRAIGHMVWLDGYLKMIHLGFRQRHDLVVLAPAAKIANEHYLDYWRNHVVVVTDSGDIKRLKRFRDHSEYGFGSIFSEGRTQGLTEAVARAQRAWEEQGRAPLLSVREEDRRRGWEALTRLGMPPEAWFATVHMREPGFDRNRQAIDPTVERIYVDQQHRNVHVEAFLPAIRLIVSRGGWVVRLGDASMTPLPPMTNVIDYALSPEKSPWMDVFLLGSAHFYLGTSSGLWCVPITFGVPAAITNVAPLATRPLSTKDLFMPKLARGKREGRLLSFAECMNEPVGYASHAGVLLRHGLTLIDNTAEEIEELTAEMLDRLDGTARSSEEDEALQARHLDLSLTRSNWGTNSRIGRDFLRRHANLLEASP